MYFIINPVFTEKDIKKITIVNLKQLSGSKSYKYFEKALAKSIRSSLRKKHSIKLIDKLPKKITDLADDGYTYLIQGEYSTVKGEITVNFRVVYVKRTVTIIQAQLTGYPDPRVFDLVD